jgi:hypothetical protein
MHYARLIGAFWPAGAFSLCTPALAFTESAIVCNRHTEQIFFALKIDTQGSSVTRFQTVFSGSCYEVYVEEEGHKTASIAARTLSGRQKWGTGPAKLCMSGSTNPDTKIRVATCTPDMVGFAMEPAIEWDWKFGLRHYIEFSPGTPGFRTLFDPSTIEVYKLFPVQNSLPPAGPSTVAPSGAKSTPAPAPAPAPGPTSNSGSANSPPPAGGPCISGNACADLVVQMRNNCIILVNRSRDKRIRVEPKDAIPRYIFTVYPSSDLLPNNQCARNWYSKYSANYE